MFHAVILAGGRGERFWPLSTPGRPKQLIDFDGGGSLIVQTLKRVSKLADPDRILVLTSKNLEHELRKHLAEREEVRVIGEPVGRNTAPAVALGAALAQREDPGAVTGVFPSDHRIGDEDGFQRALSSAIDLAGGGEYLVTIGIKPTRAETGYGYISKGENLGIDGDAYRVGRFTEKPDLRTAHQFLNSGVHLWNSGMFVWKSSTVLKSISEHLPDLSTEIDRFIETCDSDFDSALREFYVAAPSISIDYGVMERADNVAVVEARFDWDDLGAWDCIGRLHEADSKGNSIIGDAELVDTRNCTVVSEKGIIGAVGVDDLIIVHTPEATLVCSKENAQQVRRIVQAVERKNLGSDES